MSKQIKSKQKNPITKESDSYKKSENTSEQDTISTIRRTSYKQQKDVQDQKQESAEIKAMKQQIIQRIEDRILSSQKKLEDNLHQELQQFESQIGSTLSELRNDHYYTGSKSTEKESRQMEKIFKYTPSLLTEMLKSSDYKTLYHMMVASMFALMLNLWVQDYVDRGIVFDIDTFIWCFSDPQTVVFMWIFMMLSSYLTVVLVVASKTYSFTPLNSILIHSVHQIITLIIPCYLASTLIQGFGSRTIILCEAVRLMMKNYSYARNKMLYGTENKLKYFIPSQFAKKGITLQNAIFPEISIGTLDQELKRFTYFLYAPTLLYRDQYVKAPHQSKKTMIIEFGNFFLCIYYGFILFRTFCKQPILDLRENLTLANFIITIFKLMMPSTACLILLFFGLLHSWFNGWAELLRFPDRTFYHDWWSSSEFGQYYRRWNVVVHEFLYYYVYLESDKLSLGKRGRYFAQIVTFGSSAVIHEVILTCSMGFFYPICFLLFTGPGILLIRSGKELYKKSWVNIIFWLLLYIGTSLMITLYLTEYYARQRISDQEMWEHWGYLHLIVPRTLYLIMGAK